MTRDEWETFVRMTTAFDLPNNSVFMEWLWEGGSYGPGLRQDLESIAYGGWSQLFRDGYPLSWSRYEAGSIAAALSSRTSKVEIVQRIQQVARSLVDLVSDICDTGIRLDTIAGLHIPHYIFRELARLEITRQFDARLRELRETHSPTSLANVFS